ncbi:MAG TPA: DNA-processing protein DprA [Streptosporangiaceae bacterium]|nr:DNA-processing protein DprA [Streptosporangiaceae bacterium]
MTWETRGRSFSGLAVVLTCVNSVSMVGSRAATGYGNHVAIEMAAALSEHGVGIVSGGAKGTPSQLALRTVVALLLGPPPPCPEPTGTRGRLLRPAGFGKVSAVPLTFIYDPLYKLPCTCDAADPTLSRRV